MNKKYELTDETKEIGGITLHRIRALRDIPRHGVTSGDLGGWIEAESNLSQDGDAWVGGDARVCGNARVYGDAQVYGNAIVYGYARVSDNARVSGNALVGGNALVSGEAWVSGNAWVCDNAQASGNARVGDNALVSGNASISGNAWVCDNARVRGNALVVGGMVEAMRREKRGKRKAILSNRTITIKFDIAPGGVKVDNMNGGVK